MWAALMFTGTAIAVGWWAQTMRQRSGWRWTLFTLLACSAVWMLLVLGVHSGNALSEFWTEGTDTHGLASMILVNGGICAVGAGVAFLLLTGPPGDSGETVVSGFTEPPPPSRGAAGQGRTTRPDDRV